MVARSRVEMSPPSPTMNDSLSPKLSAAISEAKRNPRGVLRALAKADGYTAYRDHPVEFIDEILGEQPWSVQARIAESVRDNRYTAVPSCFGSGKDWIASRLGAWWVATGGILVATSNSFTQLKDIYWRELRQAHRKGELPGQPSWGTDLRWDASEDAWAIGRKPDDNDPEGLQGIHGARVLVVIDEANGVSPQLWEAVRGLVVNADSRVLAIGNPLEPVGPFYEACRSPNWHVIRISVFDTPNFTDEPVPAKAALELVGPQWLEDARADGLEGTPWWKAKVEGEFPDTASHAVISLNLVENARQLAHLPDAHECAGLDIARFGSDDTCLVEWSGNGPESMHVVHGHDTMEVAGLGARFLKDRRGTIAIDDGGVGGGVVDRLREQRLTGHILAVNAGESPDNDPEDRLLNMRAQLWWSARLAFQAGEVSLARLDEKDYRRLLAELTAPTYKFTSNGKVQIESKDDLKKRGVPSPDVADAFNLALYARSRARRRVTFGAAA
jgi:phage terminase large subunit